MVIIQIQADKCGRYKNRTNGYLLQYFTFQIPSLKSQNQKTPCLCQSQGKLLQRKQEQQLRECDPLDHQGREESRLDQYTRSAPRGASHGRASRRTTGGRVQRR